MTHEGGKIQQRAQNSIAREGHNSTKIPLNYDQRSLFNGGVHLNLTCLLNRGFQESSLCAFCFAPDGKNKPFSYCATLSSNQFPKSKSWYVRCAPVIMLTSPSWPGLASLTKFPRGQVLVYLACSSQELPNYYSVLFYVRKYSVMVLEILIKSITKLRSLIHLPNLKSSK